MLVHWRLRSRGICNRERKNRYRVQLAVPPFYLPLPSNLSVFFRYPIAFFVTRFLWLHSLSLLFYPFHLRSVFIDWRFRSAREWLNWKQKTKRRNVIWFGVRPKFVVAFQAERQPTQQLFSFLFACLQANAVSQRISIERLYRIKKRDVDNRRVS